MEQIELEFSILKNLQSNLLKKPKTRIYTRNTILNKLRDTKQAHDNICDVLSILEGDLENHTFNKINKKAKEISSSIYLELHQMLAHCPTFNKFKIYAILVLVVVKFRKTLTMANTEIIKTVSTLMPPYDGSIDKLENTIDALDVIETLVTDANRATIINIILTKLSGRARHTFNVKPADIQEVKNKIKAIVTVTPPETIISKMIANKQKSDLNSFTTEVESLAAQLENAYIAKRIPNDVAKDLAMKEAIKHMASGLRNEKTALILQAGTFTQLADAINKVHEVNPIYDTNVLMARAHKNNSIPTQSYEQMRNRNGYNNRFDMRNSNQRYNNQGRSGPNPIYQSFDYRSRTNNGNRSYDNNNHRANFNRRQGQLNFADNGFYRQQQPNGQQNWRNNSNQNPNAYRGNRNVYSAENVREPATAPHVSCASPMDNPGETQNQNTSQLQQVQRPNHQ
ncbi:uncharacterized protein LOC134219235 [Armigeres subalbatus]|uniref:uncharacterized protein LOC134219235 n=1 Tax=Armigeres subalbatus TaxID=124917 RepID=UPI002ED169C0